MQYMYLDGGFFWEIMGHYRDLGRNLEQLLNDIADKVGSTPAYIALFQGRFSAKSAIEHRAVDTDRIYEDQLMRCGVSTHFYPIETNGTEARERGVDVALSVHVMHDVMLYHPDTIVLVSGDQDMVPLVRMVQKLGTKVVLGAATFNRTTQTGRTKHIATSAALLRTCNRSVHIVSE